MEREPRRHILRLATVLTLVPTFAGAVGAATAQSAETILYNGDIVTVDPGFYVAEAVAIRDGRFIYVGSDSEALAHRGPGTEVIDLEGRTVIPGLIDNHVHQFTGALNLPNVDLIDAETIDDVVEAIGARVESTPPGEWVMASNRWHESRLEEGRLPTRWELDRVSPDNPVFIPRGGHVITVNSKALEVAGVDEATETPEAGVIVRDEAGRPTGVFFETATDLIERHLPPPPSPEEQRRLLRQAMAEYNGYGIVAVTEPGLNAEQIERYMELDAAGDMTMRTHVLYRFQDRAGLSRALETYRRDTGSDMLKFDGVKYLRDGGVEGGWLYHPYQLVEGEQTDPGYRGTLIMPEGYEAWVEDLTRLAAAGWQVQTHGVGDAAVDLIVQAYEEVHRTTEYDVGKLRWAVMHIFLPTEMAMRKMAELNILATAQDHPTLLGHNMRRYWGDPRAAYSIPLRDMIDHGILVGGGTDEPVVPIDPFLSMWWMTTRGTLNEYELGADQAITIREALRLYTINNAYIQGVEDIRGSIEEGKLADLVVLSDPILDVPRPAIRDIEALMTMVGGETVYRAVDF